MTNVILNFKVNYERKQIMIEDIDSLEDVLRSQLHLTSVKKGCKIIDGRVCNSLRGIENV